MIVEIALIAFLIDRLFGEFKYIPHPVVLMGKYISWFEKKFYKDSVFVGALLTISLLALVYLFVLLVLIFASSPPILAGIIASTGIASKMLLQSVRDVINSPNPKDKIAMLVSRDTKHMSDSDINKAAIETYAENLSDGIIAPLFYLLLFGLGGLFFYKAVNTLDSMVGYRNARYEKFGKFSARLDDVLNFIPARITAFLIALLFMSKRSFNHILKYGKIHSSPNAGYPIAAMAGALRIKLGGPCSYFGEIKEKPYLGSGFKKIKKIHVQKALTFHARMDIFIILFLGGLIVIL